MQVITGEISRRAKISIFIGLLALAPGCASRHGLTPSPAEGPPWPPPAGDIKAANDATVRIAGKDTAATGGGAAIEGSILRLKPGEGLSFAIYTVSGLQQALKLGLAQVDYSIAEETEGDGTCIYVGIADFKQGRWDWQKADPLAQLYTRMPDNGGDFLSSGGTMSLAVVLEGPGSAGLSQVSFTINGQTSPPAPQNLAAWADVGQISLNWNDVSVASGYNIYRSITPEFSSPEKLNSELVTDNNYVDGTVIQGKMYYYRVSAARLGESDLSNMVDIFSPQVDLALPGNPGTNERHETWVRVQWSWEGADPPDGWYVYLSETPNFSLDSPLTRTSELPFQRTTIFEDLEAGRIYYWRVAPRDGGAQGRMTDDRPLIVRGFWTWEEFDIGAGYAPLDLTSTGSTLAAAYLLDAGVKLATSTGGAFSVYDTPLTGDLEDFGFSDTVTIDYSGELFVIAAHSFAADDIHGAIGLPGGPWIERRLSGDGARWMGHPMNGFFLASAARAENFALLEVDCQTWQAFLSYYIWDGTQIATYSFEPLYPPHYSMMYQDGVLHMLYYGATPEGEHRLFYYNSLNGQVADAGPVGMFSDLAVVGGRLMSPAMSESGELNMLTYNGPGWMREVLDSGTYRTGINAQLEPNGETGAYLIYRDDSPARNWNISTYDGTTWKIYPIVLPDALLSDNISLAVLDGNPWILYTDRWRLGHVFCSKGMPPD